MKAFDAVIAVSRNLKAHMTGVAILASGCDSRPITDRLRKDAATLLHVGQLLASIRAAAEAAGNRKILDILDQEISET